MITIRLVASIIGGSVASMRDHLAKRRLRRHARTFYGQFVKSGDLAFDVGANLGNRTQILVDLDAHVVAVEPQASCVTHLSERFGDRVTIVEAAVGAEVGEAELLVASYHTLSSLSSEWVEAVQQSGRFAEFGWSERVVVPLTTLDALIELYGVPVFCKVDVEGYELEVVQGLSSPIPVLSYEFTVERIDSRLAALFHLHALGMRRFNFSWGESLELALSPWLDIDEICEFLTGPIHSPATFGDVYAAT
jgi:FkbM family methyltransferase